MRILSKNQPYEIGKRKSRDVHVYCEKTKKGGILQKKTILVVDSPF